MNTATLADLLRALGLNVLTDVPETAPAPTARLPVPSPLPIFLHYTNKQVMLMDEATAIVPSGTEVLDVVIFVDTKSGRKYVQNVRSFFDGSWLPINESAVIATDYMINKYKIKIDPESEPDPKSGDFTTDAADQLEPERDW